MPTRNAIDLTSLLPLLYPFSSSFLCANTLASSLCCCVACQHVAIKQASVYFQLVQRETFFPHFKLGAPAVFKVQICDLSWEQEAMSFSVSRF